MATGASEGSGSSFRVFLITDVRGWTRFTQTQGDAAAARLATKFARIARESVGARGGRVIELRGDEALAIFDAPAQAVRAGLELQATFAEEIQAEPELPLKAGVGIDGGEAVPVEDGFRGAALNMAARLCSSALAGEVLVTPTLAELALAQGNGDFELGPHGAAQFKGIDEPVEVMEAVDARPALAAAAPDGRAGDASAAGGELVGRDDELHWLRGTWRTCRRGRGRVVFVSGPAGIGKTRLADDLDDYVSRGGDVVIRASGGGDAAARAAQALEAAATAERPTLVVLDDLEPIAGQVAGSLSATFDAVETRPVLVLVLAADPGASSELARVLERADARGDGHRRLQPLTASGVAEIAEEYAGQEIDDVPLDAVMRSSGGVPAAVHRALLDWARSEAGRRLAAAAAWLAEGRARRAGDLGFANNVIRLRLDRRFDAPGVGARSAVCPYKGLAPFDEDDAATFFGREQLVGELAARSVGFGLLAVVGVSGSGKSSVVQAGLLPSLAAGLLPGSNRWAHVVLRPGAQPSALLDLAFAAAPAGERLVVVVDQFEEVFTICDDENARSAFVERLVELADAPDRNAVVVTIRDDFYGRCAAYPELAALLAANHVLVPPMTRDELRRASELPARRAGVRLEPALVDALVDDATEQPGALPLLSSALVELWSTRDAGWIRAASYQQTGGISGAVARLAEESFSQLDGPQREAARSVLLRLAGGEESDTITRRRVPLSELDLDGNPDAAAVVARFTDDRLLTAGDSTVEVAHEALLREWPRLRDWLDEDAEGRRLRIQITQAAAQWEGAGRDPAELFRGPRLSAALDWTATHGRELNNLEREFVAASHAASEQEARKQRRINRRLRGLLAAAVVLLVAAAVAGSVALVQRSHARHSATTAEAQRLGAQALTVTPPDQSFLYARESYNLEPSPATRGYLFAAEERSPAALAVVQPVTGRVRGMLPSPARSRQLVVSNQGGGAIVDSRTLKTERSFSFAPGVVAWAGNDAVMYVDAKTHELGFLDITTGRFSADKRLPASAYSVSNDGRLLYTLPLSGASIGVVDLRTMKQLQLIRPSHGFVFDDVEPEQGRIVVAVESSLADEAAPVRYLIWLRGLSGAPSRTVLGGPGLPPFLPYAVGGRRFVVPLARGYKVVDLDSGRHSIIGLDLGGTSTLALSPDGATLVLATLAHSGVAVVRVSDGTVENTFIGHQSQVHGVAFNTAGDVVFSGGADGRLIAWDLRGAHSLSTTRPLPGPAPQPNTDLPAGRLFSGSARGRLVAAVMGDGTVKLLAGTAPSMPVVRSIPIAPPGKPGQPTSVALDRAGDRLAVGTDDGKAIVFDTATGKRLRTVALPAHAGRPPSIVSVAFSGTGLLAAATDDGRIARFLPGGRALPLLEPTGAAEGQVGLGAIVFSPDGTRLAVVYDVGPAGLIDVYDATSGQRLYTVKTGDNVYTATFAPDGKTLISGDGDGIARFWDAATGKQAGAPILVNQGQVNSLSVDPTGKTLVAGGTDGATWLFDLATRAQIGTPLGADPSTTTAALFAGPADATPVTLAFPIAGGSPTLTRWNLRAGYLAARACTVARRNLTRLEWEQILPNLRYTKVCQAYPLTQ